MKAETILKLLNEQNYEEIKRAALAEIEVKASKTTNETKARIALAKKVAKECKHRPAMAGAFEQDGRQCITNGFFAIRYTNAIESCEKADTAGNPLNVSRLFESVKDYTKTFAVNWTALKTAFTEWKTKQPTKTEAKRLGIVYKKPLIKFTLDNVDACYIDAELLFEVEKTLVNPLIKGNPQKIIKTPVYITADNGEALVMPINATPSKYSEVESKNDVIATVTRA